MEEWTHHLDGSVCLCVKCRVPHYLPIKSLVLPFPIWSVTLQAKVPYAYRYRYNGLVVIYKCAIILHVLMCFRTILWLLSWLPLVIHLNFL